LTVNREEFEGTQKVPVVAFAYFSLGSLCVGAAVNHRDRVAQDAALKPIKTIPQVAKRFFDAVA